jgi:aldehyde:ferredoxin oxidoreductase
VFGVHGRYLRFDLSSGEAAIVPIEERVLRRFLGGVGLGTWILAREAPPGVDPLAPEAPIVFAFSPLVGTPLTTSAKFAVVAKSPLTGLLGDALSSSHFAIEGKRTGVDAIALVGRCREPSVLAGRKLFPAGDLWGKSAAEAEAALAPKGRTAAIGPAGEALVRFATISNEGRHAGRGGLGAVMGAKRLKAIVVRGEKHAPLFDPRRTVEIARDLSRRSFGAATAKYRELGTAANLLAFNRLAALPARNFREATFEGASALSAESLGPLRKRARRSCAACTIGCEHVYEIGGGRGEVRIEYESLFALGPLLGIGDPEAVLRAARLCDDFGLDTISTGGTIAFAMECGERGLLAGAPRFGDAEAALALIEDIARRRGPLGALLAEGSRRAAESIGGAAPELAHHVKGLEIPGYEPRALQTMALGFAVGMRGADHNRSGAYEVDFSGQADRLAGDERSARLAIEPEDRAALMDSLILCKFLRGVFADIWTESAAMLRAVTGWDTGAEELRAAARRIIALKKHYNIREGWTPVLDTLPRRFFEEPLLAGAAAGARLSRERFEAMVRAYNLARGWSPEGYLPEEVVADLEVPSR